MEGSKPRLKFGFGLRATEQPVAADQEEATLPEQAEAAHGNGQQALAHGESTASRAEPDWAGGENAEGAAHAGSRGSTRHLEELSDDDGLPGKPTAEPAMRPRLSGARREEGMAAEGERGERGREGNSQVERNASALVTGGERCSTEGDTHGADHERAEVQPDQEDSEPRKSKEEILLLIQGVDEGIASTELELQHLEYLVNSGQAQMLTSFDKHTMPAGAMAIYEANRAEVEQVRAQDAAVMSHKEHQDYEARPLYTRVEEAPGYMRMLERHAIVSPVVEAVIRHQVRERKRNELRLALLYRHHHKAWIGTEKEPKSGKWKRDAGGGVFADKTIDDDGQAHRNTRSRDGVRSEAEFQELLGVMQYEEKRRKSAVAVLPHMLVTAHDRQAYSFRNRNGYLADGADDNWLRKMVNTWTDEEETIFIEKLADFASRPEKEGLRKNFYKISHYLPNKTTADCVQYYYRMKKSTVFREAYRKLELKYRRTYHLKSKSQHILRTPSLAYQQSTYEATRGPQWTSQMLQRRARNDRAEAVLLRGFEGLESYTEIPADVLLPVEKEKGPAAKKKAAAAARAEAASLERRRQEEVMMQEAGASSSGAAASMNVNEEPAAHSTAATDQKPQEFSATEAKNPDNSVNALHVEDGPGMTQEAVACGAPAEASLESVTVDATLASQDQEHEQQASDLLRPEPEEADADTNMAGPDAETQDAATNGAQDAMVVESDWRSGTDANQMDDE